MLIIRFRDIKRERDNGIKGREENLETEGN